MASDKETDEPRYYGMELGVVVDDADPKKLGRVKVRVAGIIDETDWALPAANPGGGSAQRGLLQVPPKGADVCVWFHRGDPHGQVFYAGGHWGVPSAGTEIPTALKDEGVDPADASKLATWETERYLLAWDCRRGKERFRVLDKVSGDTVEMDGNKRRVTVKATGTVSIQGGAVDVVAARITLNGRPVSPTGGPI